MPKTFVLIDSLHGGLCILKLHFLLLPTTSTSLFPYSVFVPKRIERSMMSYPNQECTLAAVNETKSRRRDFPPDLKS